MIVAATHLTPVPQLLPASLSPFVAPVQRDGVLLDWELDPVAVFATADDDAHAASRALRELRERYVVRQPIGRAEHLAAAVRYARAHGSLTLGALEAVACAPVVLRGERIAALVAEAELVVELAGQDTVAVAAVQCAHQTGIVAVSGPEPVALDASCTLVGERIAVGGITADALRRTAGGWELLDHDRWWPVGAELATQMHEEYRIVRVRPGAAYATPLLRLAELGRTALASQRVLWTEWDSTW
jgi:hypothetical protein